MIGMSPAGWVAEDVSGGAGGDAGAGGHVAHQPFERRGEIALIESAGAYGPDGAARFGQALAREVSGAIERNERGLFAVAKQRLGRFDLEEDRGETLRQRVVQFARQAVALAAGGELVQGGSVMG